MYRAYWAALQRLGRAEWLARNPRSPAGDDRQVGLFVAEEWRGRRFRWTAPIAVWEVTLPGGGERRTLGLPVGELSFEPR